MPAPHLRQSPALALLLLVTLGLTACRTPPDEPVAFVTAPMSFEGELPCADCPGVLNHLDLHPDGEFLLRTAYRDRPEAPDTAGRWTQIGEGDLLQLDMGGGRTLRFAIVDGGHLRHLDQQGQPIESAPNYELRRLPTYLPVLATQLPDATWRMTHLGADPLVRDPEARQVTLRFTLNPMTVSGSTGCNNFTGAFTREAHTLTFGSIATTKMFCPDDAALETRVLTVLESTASYRTFGNLLDLRDESGRLLARYTSAD